MKNLGSLLRVIFCLGILILLGFKGRAQERKAPIVRNLHGGTAVHYQTALGVRLGNTFGITGKKFMHDGDFLELMLTSHAVKKGVAGTILYEWHRNAFEGRKWLWFYGGGGHVGYYQYKNYYTNNSEKYYKDGNFVDAGFDLIIGLEYGFDSVPITLCLDAKPFLNLVGGNTGGFDGALSVRYVF